MTKSSHKRLRVMVGSAWFLAPILSAIAQAPAGTTAAAPVAVILELRGEGVKISRQPGAWDPAHTNQTLFDGNLVQTDEHSQALVQFTGLETVRLPERATIRIRGQAGQKHGFELLKRLLYYFSRDKPDQFEGHTPQMSAIVRGTEFALEVTENGTTILSLIEGNVEMTNAFGRIEIKSGEQGIAAPGQPPRRTPLLDATNVIQWCLYYPAILDPEELRLSLEERAALSQSLVAYRQGDLVAAFASYPKDRQPTSDEERVYLAALRLPFGDVMEAQTLLDGVRVGEEPRLVHLANALRKLIAVVKGQAIPLSLDPQLSTSLLAESYWQQSMAKLPEALTAARKAAELSPKFSFAWARVAELEFSFGRTRAASEAVEKSLQLAPRNAQAHALRGFLLAARNRLSDALAAFDQAIAIDPMLANAWLGRGLCRIKQGHADIGRHDLQIAATVEPNRAVLRSYLGKAFSNEGDDQHAGKELDRAMALDPGDPTAWLYSALMRQQQNRINEAVRDLEHSQELHGNRSLFRSRLLLDQDRAVGSANLASIHRDAGMTDVSVREAARAVTYDYANPSAHLFLSDSYNDLRDPTQFNLRYETVWFNELLLANLLSPVGGGRLSQHLSQQEYSRLFEADRFGFANSTQVRSDDMLTELVSQFGTFGGTSYALDLDYRHNNGVRPNNDLDSIQWYSTIKQQITPQDTALLLVKYEDFHSGDNFQYYDPSQARRHFRFDEYQHPIAVGGWHHEWSPGIHTMLLGGRLENEQFFSDKATGQLLLVPTTNYTSEIVNFDARYHGQLETYTAELNQLFQWNDVTLSAGARYQSGTFDTSAQLYNPTGFYAPDFNGAATNAISTSEGFERITGYSYLTVEPFNQFRLVGGLAYDDITYPRNFRHPPISSGQEHRTHLGPKAGLVWNPVREATLRGAFSRSLGGVSLDESFRLEPTQIAGFPQAFRSLISESVVGSVAAPEYQTFGLALDLKFPSGTYVGIQAERLETEVRRAIGVFEATNITMAGGFLPPYIPSSTDEQLDYREDSISLSLNQLVGQEVLLGARYKFTQAKLHDLLPNVPVSALPTADLTKRSELHEASGYIQFNHSSGFFARVETHWYHQNNSGDPDAGPGDDFFQHNLFAGYRFARRRAEIRLGLLNLTGEDYRLSPLTPYAELPRKRVFEGRLSFQF